MDIRLASNTARLGAVFVRRASSRRLRRLVPPRLVGMSRAIEWACSGRLFSATEAREAGLVRSIHEPDELLPAAYELARDIAEHTSPVAVALTRQMLLRTSGAPTRARPTGSGAGLSTRWVAPRRGRGRLGLPREARRQVRDAGEHRHAVFLPLVG